MHISLRKIGFAVILGIAGAVSLAHAAHHRVDHILQALDTDHDGTIDMNETKAAAASVFDRLDRDHDGTLDKHELKGRLSVREFAAADPDNDGTLTKDEYAAAVETRFKSANKDADETVDAKELDSRPGKALRRLVR